MSKRFFFCVLIAVFICSLAGTTLSEEIRDYDSMPIVVDTPIQTDFDTPTGDSSVIPFAEWSNTQEATPAATQEATPASTQEPTPAATQEPTPATTQEPTPATTQDDASSTLEHDEGSLVRAQKRLITLGYLKGIADGIYGPNTAAALRAFQEANGLNPSGHLDADTLSLLEQLVSSSASNAEIQQRLIDLGYLRGTADGKWGPRSTAAMKSFQQLNGLSVTGTIDDATRTVLFSESVVALPSALSVGSKGDDVVALQQKLIQYGFLSGKADGAYGNQTAKAVKAFQEHLTSQGYAITADGTASSVTIFYLNQSAFSTYLGDVSLGTTGSEAKRVETRLASLGYMDAVADEEFDQYAVEALSMFQENASLPATGVADRATSDRLFSADAPAADRCVLHEIAKGDKGLVVSYVEDALYTGGMAAMLPGGRYGSDVMDAIERLYEYVQEVSPSKADLFANASRLSEKAVTVLLDGLLEPNGADNSAEVTRIQRRLHSLYYLDKYEIDGKMGGGTQSALSEFQATNGLPETGEADQASLSLLFSSEAVSKRLPYRVEVSINAQTVTVYALNDANEYEQVHQFTCSTGLGNSTPRGIFLDGYPANRWHHFKKFDCWAQYSFEIEGNIMFHSVLYSEKDTSTLRKGSVYALGSPASHGCIRLSVKSAAWLFNHCKRGSLVIVIY